MNSGFDNISDSSEKCEKLRKIQPIHFKSDRHLIRKKTCSKSFKRKNDIYISYKSNFKRLIKHCEEIINSELGEVYLHSLGNAINRVINLAILLVENSNGSFISEVNTATVDLIDGFHPLYDDADYTIQQRKNSCLHIRVSRKTKFLESMQKS